MKNFDEYKLAFRNIQTTSALYQYYLLGYSMDFDKNANQSPTNHTTGTINKHDDVENLPTVWKILLNKHEN